MHRPAAEGVVLLPGATELLERALHPSVTNDTRWGACTVLHMHVDNAPPHELIRLAGAGILRRTVQQLKPTNSLGAYACCALRTSLLRSFNYFLCVGGV